VRVTVAHIGLGSNVGRRQLTLGRSLDMLQSHEDIQVVSRSSCIETKPVGGPENQPDFINGAAEIRTSLEPLQLLSVLQYIETELGRDRCVESRWGPRTCDLDIILMGEIVMETQELTIPHPRMAERLFVLKPLAEIAPDAVHPVLRISVSQMLADVSDRGQQS
jgi:2-amino-4-hydroxy-6-hydroxymethyldihydropteridine diphosphokinase